MKLPWVLERIAHGGVFIALGLILGITFGVMYLRFYKVVHEPVPMYEQAILWVEVVLLMWSYLRAVYTVPEKFKFTPTEHEIYSMHYKDSRIDIEGMLQEPNSEEDALHLLGLGPQELKVKPFNVLQFCTVCKSYKRPRSHHCSKCGYCVNKMDHHCPWINTCVNERNHKAFCLFLFYVSVACSHGVVLTVPFFTSIIWRRKKLNWIHTICGLWCGCASFSLVVAMLMLLWEQKRGVLENATQVEEYIRYKAWDRRDFINRKNTAEQNRAKKQLKNNEPVTGWRTQLPMPDFIYPYDLGKFNNFVQVFGPTSRWWMWFLPIKPDWTDVDENNAHIDNITYWEVLPGCGQFSLTIEQLSQKAEKLRALKTVQATEEFSGAFSSWFCCWARLACRMGFKATTWHIPSVLDSRVDVKPGNTFNVTRTSNPHWYYGSKVLANSNKKGPSGWFPRLNCKNVEGEVFLIFFSFFFSFLKSHKHSPSVMNVSQTLKGCGS